MQDNRGKEENFKGANRQKTPSKCIFLMYDGFNLWGGRVMKRSGGSRDVLSLTDVHFVLDLVQIHI